MKVGIFFVLRVATKNLANAQRGTSRRQMMARVHAAKRDRQIATIITRGEMIRAKVIAVDVASPCTIIAAPHVVALARLDAHDGLPGACQEHRGWYRRCGFGIDDGGPFGDVGATRISERRGRFGLEVQIE